MTTGTLVDITPVKATIKVISEVDATLVDQTLPIGPAVKPYYESLKAGIGKKVINSVKKGLNGEKYYSFIQIDEPTGPPAGTGPDKRKKGLLMNADASGFSIRINGKTSRYAAGGQNKHIVDRAQEFGTFPLWIMYNYDGSGFLTKDSDIIGVPTEDEVKAALADMKATETPAEQEKQVSPVEKPANVKCQVCEAELTEAELKVSQLFFQKALCKKCFTEAEEILGAKKAPGRAPIPAEKKAVQPDETKPASVKEGIAPPAPTEPQEVNTKEPARPTPPPASRISISVMINLGNYESLKVGVDGDACDRDQLRAVLRDELSQYGQNSEPARMAIDSYQKRILEVRHD